MEYFYTFLKGPYLRGQTLEDAMRDLARDIYRGEENLDRAAASTIRSFVLGYRGCFENE